MSESLVKGPPDEQNICVMCGFCCDGTLFLHACLEPGERGTGFLPFWIQENSFTESDKDYFRLPCHYFSEKCTIYDRKRAYVCGSFRCQLLKDFAEGKIFVSDAAEIVREAMQIRKELLDQYKNISGNSRDTNFRQLLVELGKTQKAATDKESTGMEYEMLLARSNIFEALLIKHFRSVEDFEKMIMK
jgi:hypothetical protein